MFTEERQARILDIVRRQGSVTTGELMETLGASESTIRRDISALNQLGKLSKVHGGAVANEITTYTTKDDEVEIRKGRNSDAKLRIAKYAASLIDDCDFVYIDAGTTTEMMIEYIDAPQAAFVTNAIEHARKLSYRGYTVYLVGGEFKIATEAIVGEEAVDSLSKFNFTKGFFGSNGITINNGFTTPELKEAMIKSKAIKSTREPYVLVDGSKFGEIAAITFAEIDDAIIITDSIKDEKYKGIQNIVEVDK